MRRVPEFLPSTIFVYTFPDRLSLAAMTTERGIQNTTTAIPTEMKFVLFSSPAIVNGLLMTEVLLPDRGEVQRFFFGYQCSACREVFLVSSRVRQEYQVPLEMGHHCDPSDLRRAIRNARDLGRERGEVIMEGMNSRWWVEKPEFYSKGG